MNTHGNGKRKTEDEKRATEAGKPKGEDERRQNRRCAGNDFPGAAARSASILNLESCIPDPTSRIRLALGARLAAAVAVVLLVGGCALSRNPYQPVSYYDIRPEPGPQAKSGPALPLTLRVERFAMLGPYRTRMVYRKSAHRLAQDEYNRWIQPPEQLIGREFYRTLSASRRFRRVVTHLGIEADVMLSGSVLRLETEPNGNALLQVALRLEKPAQNKVLLSKQYEVREPLPEQTPEAFADAISKALQGILDTALADIAKAAQ